MKAIVDPQLLAKELKKVSPIIKKTTVLPVLSCVKLSFESGKLSIMATDLETIVLLTMNCECKKPFSIVVDFSSFSEVCSKLFGPITIELSDKTVNITSDNSKFKFVQEYNESEFPKIHDEEFLFSIDADLDFFLALGNANNCKSDDPYKTNMNGVLIHFKKDKVIVFGTDAFIAYKEDFKIKTGKEIQVIINDQFAQMVRVFNSGKISIGEKFVKAESGEMIVISRLADSKFCAYEAIIPSELNFNFKSDLKDLISSLSFVGIAANKTASTCAINFNGGDIKVSANDFDYGNEGETRVKATHTVEIPDIGVNGKQMLKILAFFDSQEVEMAVRGENNTIFLRPSGEPNTLCLLQPVSLKA